MCPIVPNVVKKNKKETPAKIFLLKNVNNDKVNHFVLYLQIEFFFQLATGKIGKNKRKSPVNLMF